MREGKTPRAPLWALNHLDKPEAAQVHPLMLGKPPLKPSNTPAHASQSCSQPASHFQILFSMDAQNWDTANVKGSKEPFAVNLVKPLQAVGTGGVPAPRDILLLASDLGSACWCSYAVHHQIVKTLNLKWRENTWVTVISYYSLLAAHIFWQILSLFGI